ncbi:ATP-dependent Lon protease pim1, partial [Ascosphaera atra]
MAIAQKYLAPAAKEMSGLKDVDVQLDEKAVEELIKSYCRESGVRNLKKQIEKVYRKTALNIIKDLPEQEAQAEKKEESETPAQTEGASQNVGSGETTAAQSGEPDKEKEPVVLPAKIPEDTHVYINKDNLKDYVGPPIFTADRLYETTPPGVVMGLAWTSMGGAALYVESILQSALSPSSTPSFEQTGNLQNVMKEST